MEKHKNLCVCSDCVIAFLFGWIKHITKMVWFLWIRSSFLSSQFNTHTHTQIVHINFFFFIFTINVGLCYVPHRVVLCCCRLLSIIKTSKAHYTIKYDTMLCLLWVTMIDREAMIGHSKSDCVIKSNFQNDDSYVRT